MSCKGKKSFNNSKKFSFGYPLELNLAVVVVVFVK